MTKFVFVTGGVVSGLGKGITAASLGRLLKQRGLKVAAQKLDPYLNVDPGTMNPIQHGEVFVTDDGGETDLDLGHYERFMDENLSVKYSNITSGKVYWELLTQERSGKFPGATVQIVPHVTNKIKEFIYNGAKESKADVFISEIGGTIGDIESQPFLEAIRQIGAEKRNDCLFIHVTLVPFLKASGEHKSKPTQHSVKELRALGISPNIIVTRADEPLAKGITEKIAASCSVEKDCVIENVTAGSLYEVPLLLNEKGLDAVACRELGIKAKEPDLTLWRAMTEKNKVKKNKVSIAIVGKYVELHDAYLSIIESLNHAGIATETQVTIVWVDSEKVTDATASKLLGSVDGMIVPGGFGDRGIEGKITACKYARTNNIPYLGICLGMQIAAIEFARNVCGLTKAHSAEFDKNSPDKVIHYMEGQEGKESTGGTMRLGAYPCATKEGSLLRKLYNAKEISERHRHRYEFNDAYRETFEQKGMVLSGTCPTKNNLVEAIELPSHPFFIGVQFHPEFKSRPDKAHPLFVGLILAAIERGTE